MTPFAAALRLVSFVLRLLSPWRLLSTSLFAMGIICTKITRQIRLAYLTRTYLLDWIQDILMDSSDNLMVSDASYELLIDM
jgi:hypothetical protein